MNDCWADRHLLITGASSGLGRALALAAAERGARVGLIGRRSELLRALSDELIAAGHQVGWVAADVTQCEQLHQAVRQLEDELGPCHVAIANAGVYRITDGAKYDAERATQVIATNLLGASHLLGAVLPGMVARRAGVVCGVSSLGALLPLPGGGAYGASKAALAMLLDSVRLDVARHGVQVTTVFPGFIDTPMITDEERRTIRGLLTAPQAARRILDGIERRRRNVYFPWSLAWQCRLAPWLPWPIYQWVMRFVEPLAET